MRKAALCLAVLALASCSSKKKDDQPDAATTTAASLRPLPPLTPRPAKPAQYPIEASPLAAANNLFGTSLWSALEKTGNLAISPASISLALSMLVPGAKGETASELKKVLRFADPPVDATAWGPVVNGLTTGNRAAHILIANRLYGEKTVQYDADFLATTKTGFGASLETVDFKTQPDPSRKAINAWVEEQTNKRITDLMPPDSVKDSSRLVLVNAMSFVGEWEHPFEKSRTQNAPFYVDGKSAKDVPMMTRTGRYLLAMTQSEAVLELPYKGDVSMLIALPHTKDGLAGLDKTLTTDRLRSWQVGLTGGQIHAVIPAFTVQPSASVTLSKALTKLGMPLPFDAAKADFTGIANPADPKDKISVSEVFHKAFVKVDEKGTEAAAATAAGMLASAAPPKDKPLDFIANRPFLFVIVDKKTGVILFVGRVTDPTAT